MSSQSPAAVLYDSNGVALAVYNDTVVPANTPAILFAGYDGYNAVSRYALMGAAGQISIAQSSNNVSILSNATITSPGFDIFTAQLFGTQEISIIVNATVQATGTTPSLTFTIQEVDPGNGTTTYGNSASTTALTNVNTPGVFTATLNVTTSSAVEVSWTISGAGATFAGVYVTLTTKSTPSTQTINGTITTTNNSVGTDGAAALGFDTQVGGKVTTSAPTYTNGNLNALSLTTLGGLRIDGVYVVGTANATAADVMNSGGYVTTAAPTYTTGQLNPLSLTTAGGLRIDGVYPINTVTASAPNMAQVGGIVTISAPTYTTGEINALSLDGYGSLRVTGFITTNKASTANVTSVTVTANTATSLLASNSNRIFASIYNNTNKNMYVLLGGGTASTSNFSILLITGSYWEIPNDWTGAVSEFSPLGASGAALITELSP